MATLVFCSPDVNLKDKAKRSNLLETGCLSTLFRTRVPRKRDSLPSMKVLDVSRRARLTVRSLAVWPDRIGSSSVLIYVSVCFFVRVGESEKARESLGPGRKGNSLDS